MLVKVGKFVKLRGLPHEDISSGLMRRLLYRHRTWRRYGFLLATFQGWRDLEVYSRWWPLMLSLLSRYLQYCGLYIWVKINSLKRFNDITYMKSREWAANWILVSCSPPSSPTSAFPIWVRKSGRFSGLSSLLRWQNQYLLLLQIETSLTFRPKTTHVFECSWCP